MPSILHMWIGVNQQAAKGETFTTIYNDRDYCQQSCIGC